MNKASVIQVDRWFLIKPSTDDTFRLFIFHHAGGGASYYLPMLKHFNGNISAYPVQLPGRENRLGEKLYNDLDNVTEDLVEVFKDYINKPFAFLGHSMGALIAFELTHKLHERFNLLPYHLFLSSKCPPHLEKGTYYHKESDENLLKIMLDLGGTKDGFFNDEKLVKLYLPIIRNDLQLCETYQFHRKNALDVPVTILGGLEDCTVSIKELFQWESYFRNAFNMCIFKSNHFYFEDKKELLACTISKILKDS